MLLGGSQDLSHVNGADTGTLAAQGTTDVHQAGGVTAGDEFCFGLLNVAGLIRDHCTGYVRILDCEGTAEATAFFLIRKGDQVDALYFLEQLQRAVAQLQEAQAVAGGVVGHAVREECAHIGHAGNVDQEFG